MGKLRRCPQVTQYRFRAGDAHGSESILISRRQLFHMTVSARSPKKGVLRKHSRQCLNWTILSFIQFKSVQLGCIQYVDYNICIYISTVYKPRKRA